VAHTQVERESLSRDVDHLLEECRMVLPGVQALFGFQLVAVFSYQFFERLGTTEHILHLGALFLTAVAAAMLMAPAAYHRQAEPGQVSDRFVGYASMLLTWAMVPVMLGLSIDMYVITMAMFRSMEASLAVASALLVICATLWFVMPRARRLHGRERASRGSHARRLPAS
jgi:hypothetical protein